MSMKIPISIISNENIEHMEKKLMLVKDISRNAPTYFTPPKVSFFRKFQTDLCVPFSWGRSYFHPKYLPQHSSIDFFFQGKLRDEQQILQMEALEMLHENSSCLMAVYPGGGKTITALSLLPTLQRRTLIIVNKLVLIQQWTESIQKFLGLTPTVIGGIHSKIQPNSIYIINAINIPKHSFDELDIGCVIVDECHLILTTVFSQGLFHLFPEYLVGLSATPYRTDGFNALFDLYFGVHRIERSLYKPHIVYAIQSKEKIEHENDKFGKINWNSVIQKQCESMIRQNIILYYCQQYPDRNILILCKRISQMIQIHGQLLEHRQNAELFKESDITFDENCRILVSSFQKVGTGFSFDKLDMLILGADTEEYFLQYLGRVFRRLDVKPIIIDIVDDHPVLRKHFLSRQKVYRKCGGVVQKIDWSKVRNHE